MLYVHVDDTFIAPHSFIPKYFKVIVLFQLMISLTYETGILTCLKSRQEILL